MSTPANAAPPAGMARKPSGKLSRDSAAVSHGASEMVPANISQARRGEMRARAVCAVLRRLRSARVALDAAAEGNGGGEAGVGDAARNLRISSSSAWRLAVTPVSVAKLWKVTGACGASPSLRKAPGPASARLVAWQGRVTYGSEVPCRELW